VEVGLKIFSFFHANPASATPLLTPRVIAGYTGDFHFSFFLDLLFCVDSVYLSGYEVKVRAISSFFFFSLLFDGVGWQR
jgi:hypothetical protein